MKRYPSPKQGEVLVKVCGLDPLKFDTTYNELVLMVGQKGGKNFVIEILVAYYLYKLCNIINLHEFFGVDKSVNFDISNSSLVNERQARDVFFNRIKQIIRRTIDPATGDNWFERYMGMDMRPKGFGDMKSREITIQTEGEDYGKIVFHSFDSTDSAPEGLEIFLGIMDEPSRANTPALYENASSLYKVYQGNIQGAWPNGLGKLLIFSYPEQDTNDLTVERYEKGQKEKQTFVMKASTFEFNPYRRKEDYVKAYENDPIDSACRYECIIPGSKYGFFKPYFHKIEECINAQLENRVRSKPTITRREVTQSDGTVKVHEFTSIEVLDIQGDDRYRVWAGDTSKSGDSFIIAGGYSLFFNDPALKKEVVFRKYDRDGIEREEKIDLNGKVVIDIILIWKPSPKYVIDFIDIENVIINQLLKKFPNSIGFHFDQYNSESLRQKILQFGLECEVHHFSNPQQVRLYTVLRALVWNNMIEYLDRSQYCDLKDVDVSTELRKLLLINKNKIDHPEGGSKDIADVFALVSYYSLLSEYVSKMLLDVPSEKDINIDEIARRYLATIQNLSLNFGRQPNDEEIAEHMKVPLDWLPEIREYLSEPFGKELGEIEKESY